MTLAKDVGKQEVEKAYRLYERGIDPDQTALKQQLYRLTGSLGPSLEDKNTLPIYFIGVWDTVAALHTSETAPRIWFFDITECRSHHQTELPKNVTHARHALAAHERRASFEPLLWQRRHRDNPAQTLEQVWFAGAHADVGGGYSQDGLSRVSLVWMASQASLDGHKQLIRNIEGLPVEAPIVHQEWLEWEKFAEHTNVLNWAKAAGLGSAPVIKDGVVARTRPALSPAKLSPKTRETIYFHEDLLRHLSSNPRSYGDDPFVCSKLKAVDSAAADALFELSYSRFRIVADQKKVDHLEPTRSDVMKCRYEIKEFRRWWDDIDIQSYDLYFEELINETQRKEYFNLNINNILNRYCLILSTNIDNALMILKNIKESISKNSNIRLEKIDVLKCLHFDFAVEVFIESHFPFGYDEAFSYVDGLRIGDQLKVRLLAQLPTESKTQDRDNKEVIDLLSRKNNQT